MQNTVAIDGFCAAEDLRSCLFHSLFALIICRRCYWSMHCRCLKFSHNEEIRSQISELECLRCRRFIVNYVKRTQIDPTAIIMSTRENTDAGSSCSKGWWPRALEDFYNSSPARCSQESVMAKGPAEIAYVTYYSFRICQWQLDLFSHGPIFIGLMFNILLYGIMTTQTYLYFTTFKR